MDRRLNGAAITVTQDGATVRLAGELNSLVLRYVAEEIARSAPGVGSVDARDLHFARTYTVQRGEGLWDVSMKVYGTGRYVRSIAKMNRLAAPYRLRVGQKLLLPEP